MNNPLKYVDPDGNWAGWDDLVAIVLGGTINLGSHLIDGEVTSFWHGLSLFGVGAASAEASLYFTPVAGSVILGAGNSTVNQGFTKGLGGISWWRVFGDAVISGLTSQIGFIGQKCFGAVSKLTGNISNDILRETLQNALSDGTTGFVVGTASAVADGAYVESSLKSGVKAGMYGLATGTLKGVSVGCNQKASKNRNAILQDAQPEQARPTERHHFATNKNKKYTPKMERIAEKYDFKLDGDWNIEPLPHRGRHPNAYHEWVLDRMQRIDEMPNMTQSRFIDLFQQRVVKPVRENPEMLRKSYWK